MKNKKAEELLKKYLKGICTPEEKAVIESWYLEKSAENKSVEDNDTDYFAIEGEIWSNLKRKRKNTKVIWFSAAAVAAALTTLVIYFSYTDNIHPQLAKNQDKILPGNNKATLTLSNGSKIDLNSSQYGVLAKEAGVNIKKTADGQLVYDIAQQESSLSITYNTIETPKGGQYQVNLPDGTKVWLNAASSIRFPTVFNGKERVVEISGEAYFEVTPDKEKPFKVNTTYQIIEVLGTHFNVNAYADEQMTRTSLLEGAVKVFVLGGSTVIIKPGEQTVLYKTDNMLTVQKADTEEAIAWKNGYFQFNNESIESIMRKISRWYDIEIVYQKGFVNQGFVGSISRFEDVSKVLRMLELTGAVHFRIEERRIIVMP